MQIKNQVYLLDGGAGKIETLVEKANEMPRGVALIAHPHPLGGGANNNKVVHTLARVFLSLGYVALRPNFRGVGQSEGVHDEGIGESDDLLRVLDWAVRHFGPLPVALAGFSFGAYCQTRVFAALAAAEKSVEGMVLVGTAAGFIEGARQYDTGRVPPDTLIIHGAKDTTVPLENVLAWAEPQNLSVVVVPGSDHFFDRRLACLRDIVTRYWRH